MAEGTRGLTPEEIQFGAKPEPGDSPYMDHAIIEQKGENIDIHARWDKMYGAYVIFFPNIDLHDQRAQNRVGDQLIVLNDDQNTAKKVFDFAMKEASKVQDVYELFVSVQKFYLDLLSEKNTSGE